MEQPPLHAPGRRLPHSWMEQGAGGASSNPLGSHKPAPVFPQPSSCVPQAGRVGAPPLLCVSGPGRQPALPTALGILGWEKVRTEGFGPLDIPAALRMGWNVLILQPQGLPSSSGCASQCTAAPLQPPAPSKRFQCFGHCAGDNFPVSDHVQSQQQTISKTICLWACRRGQPKPSSRGHSLPRLASSAQSLLHGKPRTHSLQKAHGFFP